MAITGQGMHHLNIRKRIHEKHEQFPSPEKKIRFLDKLIYIVGIVGPLMILPQIIKIFALKTAEGLSLISYASFVLLSIIWLIYGIAHNEKPIIITNILWIALHILIVIGILIYGKGFL